MPPVFLLSHRRNERFGGCAVDDRDEYSLVRHIEGIEAKQAEVVDL